jgi:ketosteroid isomerase-like protein
MPNIKFISLCFAALSISQSFAQPGLKTDDKTTAYLKKFRTAYTQSIIGKKPEQLQSYYAANLRLMPEFQKTMRGKENVLAYHQAFAARYDIRDLKREEMEILDFGTRVAEFGTFTLKLAAKTTGQEQELKGKYMDIWEKAANGTLTLVTQAWNYSHRLSDPEQVKFHALPVVNIAFEPHVPINNNISYELAALNSLQEIAVTQHDAKVWGLHYAEDVMLFYSNSPVYKGKKEIEAFLAEHVQHLPVFEKLDIRNDQIDHLGEYVIEYASHTAIVRDGDWSGVGTGKDVRIWHREKDGSLKVFRAVAMYD